MTGQCKLDTEQGVIVIEMLPAKAPKRCETLNLAATGSLDTTTFSRVVPGFVIQGGNLQTSEKWNQQLANRWVRPPDEPSDLKHERGVVDGLHRRTQQWDYALLHFGWRWSASRRQVFGVCRVRSGIEVADSD